MIFSERFIELPSMTPSRILRHILDDLDNSKEYTYLIIGKYGPTGKTWLCDGLKRYDYRAFDLNDSAYISLIGKYADNKNHYHIIPDQKLVIITLNELFYD